MVINFNVRNQAMCCNSHRFVAADSVKFLKAKFVFDEDWTGYTVTVTFTNLDTKVSRKVLLDGTHVCEIPHEILAGKGRMNVYAEGICGDSVATTAMMKHPLLIRESGRWQAGESILPTPDIYQQILMRLNDFQEGEDLKRKITEAVEAYFAGHPSLGGAGIQSVGINEEGHLIVTLASGDAIDAGLLPEGAPGEDGADGYTPSIEVETDTDTEYRLNIINKDMTITTPNLRNDSTPVGTVISYMGVRAPAGYLVCDGMQYQVADYPALAEHFRAHFDSVKYFGGDGVETFAVPDLRGEFLRGTGEAARNTGRGNAVGVHQPPTENMYTAVENDGTGHYVYHENDTTGYNQPWYIDKHIYASSESSFVGVNMGKGVTFTPPHRLMRYTSRPTNTSILWCIKYC